MIRGLGATARVILSLLNDPEFGDDQVRAAELVMDFHVRYMCAAEVGLGWTTTNEPTTEELLTLVEASFSLSQRRISEEILDALDAQDARRALYLLAEKEDTQFQGIHDVLLDLMARSFDLAYRERGSEGLEAFQMGLAEGQRSGFDAWERLSSHDFVKAYAFLLKQHRSDLLVREETDAWVIDQSYCGSGGRLILQGRYSGEESLSTVPGPNPVCGGLSELPVYCTHCVVWNGMAPDMWYGHPHIELLDAAQPGGGCSLRVPKNR